VTLIHEDTEENTLPIKLLRYRASLILTVEGFISGYSKDADGEVELSQLIPYQKQHGSELN
jgi:hypothetical protein